MYEHAPRITPFEIDYDNAVLINCYCIQAGNYKSSSNYCPLRSQAMVNVIETNALTKSFNGLTAVDKLDIAVESGEIFGLLGPNGAGKTTTISMLCTILKPTSGSATVNGFDIAKEPNQVR
ncbi:MAG TPA: ATP-binding cassette domain-containing protein, partial [Saprospiraceae bacterium]|nr:ATP-binding cassette domain-containing protein [Saprospiraceae bacterium]